MQTKTHVRVAKFAAIAIALTLFFSSLLLAQQTITATLSGAVSDSSVPFLGCKNYTDGAGAGLLTHLHN